MDDFFSQAWADVEMLWVPVDSRVWARESGFACGYVTVRVCHGVEVGVGVEESLGLSTFFFTLSRFALFRLLSF